MRASPRIVLVAGALAALLGACRGGGGTGDVPADGATKTVRDALGREVRAPVIPKRIVSLAPAITETLFAVGAGSQVVGVTRYCNFPKEADALPEVGGFADADVERIARLAPDLVFVTADTVAKDRFDALVALGIPAYVTDADDFAGVAKSIRDVAAVAGHESAGDALARTFEERRLAVVSKVGALPRKRVLFLFQADPAIAAGKDTFLDELVRAAGGENVAASAPTSYPRFGLEVIVALAPELVLTTMPETAETLRGLLDGSPIDAKRVIPVDGDLVERPGPRLVVGLENVAALLHPDAFRAGTK